MKKIIFYSSFIVFFMSACGQSPETKIHVYSRITLPGIRPDTDNDNNIFPKTYFIYAEVEKAAKATVEGCWIDGKYYTVSGFEKVSSPVIVADQSVIKDQMDTLVQKTANDVYHIIPGIETSRVPADENEKKLVGQNQFVLIVKVNGKLQFVSSSKIKELTPAAMM
jgi:hypothetical protein